jgi:hypothetical protein
LDRVVEAVVKVVVEAVVVEAMIPVITIEVLEG